MKAYEHIRLLSCVVILLIYLLFVRSEIIHSCPAWPTMKGRLIKPTSPPAWSRSMKGSLLSFSFYLLSGVFTDVKPMPLLLPFCIISVLCTSKVEAVHIEMECQLT